MRPTPSAGETYLSDDVALIVLGAVGVDVGSSDALSSIVVREVRPLARRVCLVLGFGFLVLVAVPASAAIALALSGGPDPVAFGLLAVALLGFLLLLAALPFAAVGLVWLLGLATVSALGAYVADRRLRLLSRVEAAEEARWWGRFVRPSALLGFLDPRTAGERFEADLEEAKSAYVAGDVSEGQFERRLDRLFGLEAPGNASDDAERLRTRASLERSEGRRAAVTERSAK